jgi:predicted PurR-regulated permease PerM
MTSKDKLFFWLFGIFALGLFVYLVSSILLPFVVAAIAAYFLNPAADRIQKLGISRTFSTTIITISFFLLTITITALLAPIFYNQFLTFLNTIPTYVTYINNSILPEFSRILEKIDPSAIEKIKSSIGDFSGYALKFIGSLVTNLFNSGIAILNILSLLFITPVVTFYMLRDWHKILDKINSWLPVKNAALIRKQAKAIDNILAGYIRGQTQVCLLVGAFYAILLTIAGLEFSVFIGLATGLLLFIPYVGTLFGFTVGILVAFFQFGDMQHIGIISAIFIIGQIIESTFITPNLVGNKVGLHPAWIMFGLLAGGAMFGFIGVLMAVPVTAVTGVMIRLLITQYLKSPAYLNARKTTLKKKA